MKKLTLLAALAFATLAHAQHPLTFEDLAGFKRLGTPALSPDGKWIAYDVTTIDLPKNSRSNAIWLMRADGTGAHEIVKGDGPAWSPDGKTIAYGYGGQIALYDIASGKAVKPPSLAGGASSLKWMPDGKAILAVSDIHPDCGVEAKCTAAKEEALKAAPTKARVLDSLLYRHWNAWQAPTRAHILYVPIESGVVRDLTPGAFDAPPFSVGGGGEFDVSPDGKELVYARNTDEHPERSTNSDLFLVPITGGEPRRITTRTGADTTPQYSPDGRWIAWRSQARAGYESDQWELWLYDRDTKQSKRVAADFTNDFDEIRWSRDSRTILAVCAHEGHESIYEVTLDGRMTLVYDTGSAAGLQAAPGARAIYFELSTLGRPADIYSLTRGSNTPVQLTHHNDALLASVRMASYEPIWWTGAENARVQGWLVKPPNFDPAKKYPAVVLIHGGPQGMWGDAWSYRWNPQMFAARGYVVFAPNPRGSTGFGHQFEEEISRDWAGKAYTDIMNGVDVVAALPYVDANRMGAAGASYGGYMIDWILGHSTRFKALVSHDGVYDLESMYGGTEELWFAEWELGGTPWEHPELYATLSPHKYAKNFQTPTLVVHGELDYRVPVGQGFELFTALQRRGVPSRMLYFPDEGHWVLKPQNSKLWHETVLGWLDRWLK